MTTPFLAHDIECEENRECRSYPDPLTGGEPWTIGVGHTGPEVGPGLVWSDDQINAALASDINHATQALNVHYPWWTELSDERQDVLVQMVFQMGIHGLADFPKALAAMQAKDWQAAHDQMLDSDWFRKQTPKRAAREAQQMLTSIRVWAS